MKVMNIIFRYLFFFYFFIPESWAQDITGMWKAVDDKSGYVRAKIQIYKINNSYEGRIEEVYALPGNSAPFSEKCFRCKGELKDSPLIGMRILYGFKNSPTKSDEYSGGNIIDPMSGNIYKGKIKMNLTGTRVTVRGFVGTSALGRSQIWIRIE